MDSNLSRRRFLETSAAVIGVSLLGCSAETPAPPTGEAPGTGASRAQAKANGDGTFTLARVAVVTKGTALAFTFPNGEPGLYFVTKSGEKGAVSAKCTHLGCKVEWQDDAAVQLRCPCHESHFALDGKVLSGPAKAPLAHYSVTQSDDEVILKLV